jgi:muconolactone D-isomerase
MLYLIEVDIDYARMGEARESLIAQEWKRSNELYKAGIMLRIWRRADARGVVAVWNCASHEEVSDNIRKMPMYPYFSNLKLTPLLPHPSFPQFCESDWHLFNPDS